MSKSSKISLYLAFAIGALVCGLGFSRWFSEVTARPQPPSGATNQAQTVEITPAAKTEDHRKSRMMWYGAGLFLSVLGLGLMVAYDATRHFAHRVEDFIWDSEGEAYRTPEYEEAEQLWANGQHLEAVELLRNYLKTHPREQYVAIRIAEIYEKDLGNSIAAALEYEEILRKPLPREKWGWTAIHLANLYSGKLNKPADAEKLLRRIVKEYSDTAAANKARERLGETPGDGSAQASEATPSNLPPGFRPK